jgi:hypothetical protein
MQNQICVIEEDLSVERAGFYRAFWTDSFDAPTQCTVFGYCSAIGSHRTIWECAATVRKYYGADTPIFRNGRAV